MFKIRQYVNHRYSGVCLIKDICPMANKPDGPTYYVLEPLFGEDKGSIVRVPTDNQTSIRALLTKKEIISIIKSFNLKENSYIDDTKLRKNTYETYIGSGQIDKIAQLLFSAKKKRDIDNKLNSIDKQFINKAEPIVYGNFATSLGIPLEKVDRFIEKH